MLLSWLERANVPVTMRAWTAQTRARS